MSFFSSFQSKFSSSYTGQYIEAIIESIANYHLDDNESVPDILKDGVQNARGGSH